MTPEAQRIAIAEWCGWTFKTLGDGVRYPVRPDKTFPGIIPDYYNDHNAIHEAEKLLTETGDAGSKWEYITQLSYITNSDEYSHNPWTRRDVLGCCFATAPQRCEALLRTLNLWKDTP